jgi:hypothetical protein
VTGGETGNNQPQQDTAMETKRTLTIMSDTYCGRREPLTTEEIRRNIETALLAFNEVVPDAEIFGYSYEDYGWYCVLTPEMEADIISRFPDSVVDGEFVCIHNHGKHQDMFMVSEGRTVMVFVCNEDTKGQLTTPVQRTLDAMFTDWFDNYGKY